jgi:alpha-D-ribose 1-methylphosphonate 5-phosphate C-P lyase
LRNVRQVVISGMQAPGGSRILAQISGSDSSGIKLTADTLGHGQQAVSFTGGASPDAATVD